jgi:hypothetical protein
MRAIDIDMVTLGNGRFVRADEIVAVLPIEEGRGRGRRTRRPRDGARGRNRGFTVEGADPGGYEERERLEPAAAELG